MSKVLNIALITHPASQPGKFTERVVDQVNRGQYVGRHVDIQFQMTDATLGALVITRAPK